MSTNGKWPLVPLRDVVTPVSRRVSVEAVEEYDLLGARWYAKGLYTKDRKLGSEIKASHLYRVVKSDFVYNRLFAWKGSFAVATEENDGCYVSNEFPCFHVSTDRLIPQFLWYHFSRSSVWNDALGKSYGATTASRNRLKEIDLLNLAIPLPSIEEQRRIVAQIDSLVANLNEVKLIRQLQIEEANAMLGSRFSQITSDVPRKKMSIVAPLVRRPAKLEVGGRYPELGIRSYGKGTFHKPALDYLEVGSKKLYSIEPGDLVFSNVFAWEGAIAVAQPEDSGRFGSHRFITCLPDKGIATADFLCFYFLTTEGLERIGAASPGGAGRNRTLGLNKLAEIDVPVPPYESQIKFDRLIHKVREMRQTLELTDAEINALVPSILDRAFQGGL